MCVCVCVCVCVYMNTPIHAHIQVAVLHQLGVRTCMYCIETRWVPLSAWPQAMVGVLEEAISSLEG